MVATLERAEIQTQSIQDRARERLNQALAWLKAAEAGKVGKGQMYCCDAAKKAMVSEAKKNIRHWQGFLETSALLSMTQTEMFDEDIENDDEDDF